MIKLLFLLGLGFYGGLWVAWPGVISKGNWNCAAEIIMKSKDQRTDMRAILAVSPKYLLNDKKNGPLEKLRIVGDACFR
tara:strand:+ start:816 stop:1052 length:237 start_codon:yes stop_codon:yes gene_type:complete